MIGQTCHLTKFIINIWFYVIFSIVPIRPTIYLVNINDTLEIDNSEEKLLKVCL